MQDLGVADRYSHSAANEFSMDNPRRSARERKGQSAAVLESFMPEYDLPAPRGQNEGSASSGGGGGRQLTRFDITKKLKFSEKQPLKPIQEIQSYNFQSLTLTNSPQRQRYLWPSGNNVNHFIQAVFKVRLSSFVLWCASHY